MIIDVFEFCGIATLIFGGIYLTKFKMFWDILEWGFAIGTPIGVVTWVYLAHLWSVGKIGCCN